MKQTLMDEVNAELVPAAERLAGELGVTLSSPVEQALRDARNRTPIESRVS